jgi:23S rRNA (cytosine1962-C5)-methyltransferase
VLFHPIVEELKRQSVKSKIPPRGARPHSEKGAARPLQKTGARADASRPARTEPPAREPARDVVREKREAKIVQPPQQLPLRAGARPAEKTPVILETPGEAGYRLLDSGAGEKLEQYGDLIVIRPEAQALWPKALPAWRWEKADAIFTGDTDEEGMGRWRFPRQPLGETWPMQLLGVDFFGRLTSFRHVGVFPEQLVHWSWMRDMVRARGGKPKVLNLFGYTGVASLIGADAGAEVTHVDASKKAINWGKENQQLARLTDKPIRWILDDAMKFIERERRRGNVYDIILTDPPKFGRGPDGEVWQLFDHLPVMLDICRDLLAPNAIGLVLTAYSIRASFYSMHELMMETMRGMGGLVESGELIIRETPSEPDQAARALSTSLFSRWTKS